MKALSTFIKIMILSMFGGGLAHALSVSPMSADYELIGDKTSVVYTVANPSDEPVAIEVSVERRTTAADGKEITDDSDAVKKAFSVFPAATFIPAKQKKGIRVVYVGPKNITSEKAYRIVITEIPMKVDGADKNAVKMLRKFRTTGYVHPKGVTPDLKLVNVEALGTDKLVLRFQNQGTSHQLIQKLSIKLTDETGASVSVGEKAEPALLTNFLSGEERRVEVKRPTELKGKVPSGSIELME